MNNIEFQMNRRSFLNRSGVGIGSVALASMLNDELKAENKPIEKWTGVIKKPHLPVKAKKSNPLVYGRWSFALRNFGLQTRACQNEW